MYALVDGFRDWFLSMGLDFSMGALFGDFICYYGFHMIEY